jgi:hypothetical protein
MSDEALVDQMKSRLAARDYRFSTMVETIVLSPQFLNRRLPEKPYVQKADLLPSDAKPIKVASKKGN